jgi:para-nitrobenzyl esterase
MASPLAKGAFHRAIGQSGGSLFARILAKLDQAEQSGSQFAKAIGAPTLDELRAKPAREIQLARPPGDKLVELYDSNDAGGIDRANAWPIVDGHLLTEKVFDTFARGAQNDVPLLTGATADEGSTQPAIATLAEFKRRAATEYDASAAAFHKVFPANSDIEAQQSGRRIIGTRVFNWENWTWAKMQAATGRSDAYFYHFEHAPPKPIVGDRGDLSRDIGAFHTAEIPYVFQTLQARSWPWQDKDRELSNAMAAYWVNFASSGNPNGPGLPNWPRFDSQKPTTLHFSNEIRVGDVPDMATLEFWTSFDQQIRKSSKA